MPIRVSQESRAGAGDFRQHILGHIKAIAFAGSADEAYAYNQFSRFSFNGARPVLRANVSHLFFVEAREGLTLFVVHDTVDDPDGGSASMRIQVVGNRTKARFLVRDDAFAQSDGYNANAAGTDFLAWHSWYPCCTDGLVLGPFSGDWKVYVQFTGEDPSAEFVQGLTNWEAVSDHDRIPLVLERGRRVLLEPLDTFVFGPKPDGRNLTRMLKKATSGVLARMIHVPSATSVNCAPPQAVLACRSSAYFSMPASLLTPCDLIWRTFDALATRGHE